MSKGKKPKRPGGPAGGGSRRWHAARPLVAALLTLAAVLGVLAGLGWLGNEALRGIGKRDRYTARFADVVCDAPPGTDRPRFLAEVRYVANHPDTYNALDPVDRGQLAAAFALHPWVESVDGVAVEPGNVVRVSLKFRTPVLAVNLAGGAVRMVDGTGVLLPEADVPVGVARLVNPVQSPTVAAGKVWENDAVKRALGLVKAYSPVLVEWRWTGWRLTLPDGRVLFVGG